MAETLEQEIGRLEMRLGEIVLGEYSNEKQCYEVRKDITEAEIREFKACEKRIHEIDSQLHPGQEGQMQSWWFTFHNTWTKPGRYPKD